MADGDVSDGAEIDEVDDGDGAVGGGDVGVEAEAGAEEGRAMFDEEEDEGGEEEDAEEG